MRFLTRKVLKDISRGLQKMMRKSKISSCGISKNVMLHMCWMDMNRARKQQEHIEGQEPEVLIWHMSRKNRSASRRRAPLNNFTTCIITYGINERNRKNVQREKDDNVSEA